MITSCNNCGLPIFHGAAGYAGAQCRCGFSAKPNCGHNALADLLKERDQLRAENERLKSEVATVKKVAYGNIDLLDENNTLRKQLEEARELVRRLTDYRPPRTKDTSTAIAWLERNKQ